MRLRLVSWNINSVRLRLGALLRVIDDLDPDVFCIQETKCRDDHFPSAELHKRGYLHCALHGQKGYHGAAIVSRLPFHEVRRHDFCGKGDARHIQVCFDAGAGAAAGIVLHNVYVPAGGDVPDPVANPKFAHKLAFLDEMRGWTARENGAGARAILVGDLNVAPLESDVWSHKAMLRVVSHTPIEVEKLTAVMEAGAWRDAMRAFVPPAQTLFTWWSYRSPDWARADKGRRLDHVWLSPDLMPRATSVQVLRAVRSWERPSDHVPVVVDMEL